MALPAFTLSPTEAAALFDLSEKQVRKEVEHGLFGAASPPRLGFPAVVYLRVLRLLDLDLGVDDRRKLLAKIVGALGASGTPEVLDLSNVLSLRLGNVMREVTDKIDSFATWKATLVSSPDTLGGEPVFAGSRLAVRRVGGLAERGESESAIRADYPYLTAKDIEYAKLYTRAYPRVGRPREPR